MNKLSIERMTPELWDKFNSLWHFSVNEVDPSIPQGYYSKSIYSYIVLEGTEPIGAFGLFTIWNGVGEAWLMSSPRLNKFPVFLVKNFRQLSDEVLRRGLHRIQILVHNTKTLARWAETLGFEYEGFLRKYTADGQDILIYSKVWA